MVQSNITRAKLGLKLASSSCASPGRVGRSP